MGRQPGDAVETRTIGTPIVINDGLREVVAVGQWSAGNVCISRVNGIQTHSDVRGTVQPGGFAFEFLRQLVINSCSFTAFDLLGAHLLARFIEKARALHARPGAHPLISSLNQA